mgnify:CR=1 FL=1
MASTLSSARSATTTRLAVAPARSSLAMDLVAPTSARWAAACSTVRAEPQGRPTTTTRPDAVSRLSDGATTARSRSRSAGPAIAVRSTMIAAAGRVSKGSPTSTPSAANNVRARSAMGVSSPSPPISAGPSRSGASTAYRRKSVGLGSPSESTRRLPSGEARSAAYGSEPSSAMSGRLEDRDDALAAGGADGDQPSA